MFVVIVALYFSLVSARHKAFVRELIAWRRTRPAPFFHAPKHNSPIYRFSKSICWINTDFGRVGKQQNIPSAAGACLHVRVRARGSTLLSSREPAPSCDFAPGIGSAAADPNHPLSRIHLSTFLNRPPAFLPLHTSCPPLYQI